MLFYERKSAKTIIRTAFGFSSFVCKFNNRFLFFLTKFIPIRNFIRTAVTTHANPVFIEAADELAG